MMIESSTRAFNNSKKASPNEFERIDKKLPHQEASSSERHHIIVSHPFFLRFLTSHTQDSKRRNEEKTHPKHTREEMSLRDPPKGMIEKISKSREQFLEFRENVGDVEAGWTKKRDANGIRVFSQNPKSTSAYRLAAVFTFKGVDPVKVGEEATFYDRRKKWDDGLKTSEIVESFNQNSQIVSYTTHPALGGIVKSRIFIDCRQIVHDKTKEDYINCCTEWKSDKVNTKGYVLAHNLPGSGLSITKTSSGEYRFVMIGLTDLGGWLSTRLTNEPTVDAYYKIASGLSSKIVEWGGKVIIQDKS